MKKLLKILTFFFLFLNFFTYANGSIISPIAIDINSDVDGNITALSDISPYSHNSSEYYTFTLTQTKNVVINLTSDIYYKMYLLDDNGSILKEVSKYDYPNTKFVLSLPSGTYKIDVTTVFEEEYGAFTLSLKENIIKSTPIPLESITDGEWTNNSGISSRSKNYTNYYTFTLTERTEVLIDLSGSNTKELYLLDSNGSIVESELGDYESAKIIKILEAGSYVIDVTNDYEGMTGVYTLRFKENIISNTNISIGDSIDGAWSISSGTSPSSKNFTNYYTFLVTERTDIIITLNGNSGYKQLYLLDANNTIVNAVSKSGYNNARLIVTLDAGTYKIDATTSDNVTGNYTLGIKKNIISTANIELNTTISGEWLTTSGISPRSNTYSNNYIFTLTEQKDIIIYVSVNHAGIYLLDDNNSIIKTSYGDAYGGSRLIKTLEPGTYKIDISSSIYREIGEYNLSLRENIVSNTNIELNGIVNGEWLSTSGISPRTTSFSNNYTFILDKPTDILIDLLSDNDESLFLLDNNRNIIDSAWYGRIVKRLDAGTYIIDATINDGIEVGSYALTFKENIRSTTDIIFNQNTYGAWTSTSGVSSRSNRFVNNYTFTLARSKEITINMASKNDIEFYIQDDSGSVFDDVYGYYEHNATLTRVFDAGTYTIGVTTSYSEELGDYSILVSTDIYIPTPIDELSITKIGSFSSRMTWKNNTEDVVGYKIYINNQLMDTIDADINYYDIGSLKPNSEYNYSIVAYNSAGESESVSGTFKTKKDDYAWLVPVYHIILY